MNYFTRGLLAVSALTLVTSSALAADLVEYAPSVPTVEAAPEALSPWQIRIRAMGVITENNGHVKGIRGSDLSATDTVMPELDISYYFTDNIAAELVLGTTYANIHGKGSISSLDKIGKTWLLPPTLTLQYHFTNFGAFKPYVGAGVNYTVFYNQDADSVSHLKVKDTFGAALQVGFDYMLDRHWGVNFDVKKLFLEPQFNATLENGDRVRGKAELNPWLVSAGVTYRF